MCVNISFCTIISQLIIIIAQCLCQLFVSVGKFLQTAAKTNPSSNNEDNDDSNNNGNDNNSNNNVNDDNSNNYIY